MKTKNMYKIGLSLLIALTFILPSGSILADPLGKPSETRGAGAGTVDAGALDKEKYAGENYDPEMVKKLPSDINPQVSEVDILGAAVENPAEEVFGLSAGDKIPVEDFYKFFALIQNSGDETALIKPHLELYTINECTDKDLIYSTSFEDNYDVYNNWIQVDGDCGVIGGQYDSWTHSDARSSDGDFSMHSTMYSEYKAHQDDYLETRNRYNFSEYDWIEVKFDIWVEGELDECYNYYDGEYEYCPYDYLDFEVWDDGDWYNPCGYTLYNHDAVDSCDHYECPNYVSNPMCNWFTESDGLGWLPGSFYFGDTSIGAYAPDAWEDYLSFSQTSKCTPEDIDIGGGWWQIQCTLPASWFYDIENVGFRFSWHTDVENQFEGAYVDNVRIFGIKNIKEKIFQSHSQGEQEWDIDSYAFEFPLAWNDVEKGNYELHLWVENHNGITNNDYPDRLIIPFEVVDDIDCEILGISVEDSFTQQDVPDGGRMYFGSDAHIEFDFHNDGNLPVSDVEIVASANKIEWEILYEDDFEGMVWSDHGAFDGPDLWHKTSVDSWSGTSCLGCFNKDTNHYENNMYVNYVHGPNVDMEGVIECEVDYYAKWITEGSMDLCYFELSDASTNFILGCGSPYAFYGFQPTWIGPNNPQGIYQPFDLKYYYDYWHDVRGMFRNADGSPAYDVAFGWRVHETDASVYTNAYAEEMGLYWSGWYFDDVTIRAKVLTDEVWSDTMILPGPIEPCETVHAQFEWEDLPYSCYRITVAANCEEAVTCCPEDNNFKYIDICVLDDLEYATDPKVESCDLTDYGDGEWVVSSGGNNYYMATQQGTWYASNADQIALLCPNGDCPTDDCPGCPEECALDISHLYGTGIPAAPVTLFTEDWELGIIPPTWTAIDLSAIPGTGWFIDSYAGSTSYQVPTGSGLYFANIDSDFYPSAYVEGYLISPPIDLTGGGSLQPTVDLTYEHCYDDFGYGFAEVLLYDLGMPIAQLHLFPTGSSSLGPITDTIDTTIMVDPTTAQIVFHYIGDYDWNFGVDDIEVTGWTFPVGAPGLNGYIHFDLWYDTEAVGFMGWIYDYLVVEVTDSLDCDEITEWTTVDTFYQYGPDTYDLYPPLGPYSIPGTIEVDPQGHLTGWIRDHTIDLSALYNDGIITGPQMWFRFRFISDSGYELRGVRIDNFVFEDLFDVTEITDPEPVFEDFEDDFESGTLDNWCTSNLAIGQYWETVGPTEWCNYFPAEPLNDALVWDTEIADAYEAYLYVTMDYEFASNPHGTVGYIEISTDGDNWFVLDYLHGTATETEMYDISFLSGNDVLIRFRVDGRHAYLAGYSPTAGHFCIEDVYIVGKKDTTAPMTQISMTGTMTDAGWYSSAVSCTITAVDDAGMGDIHYILDGVETVVPGTIATFTVSGNGPHNIEFWGVDAVGNEETPHNIVPTFRIDAGSPPSVSITEPTPGLYLFGNKLLSLSKIFIIGAFNIEATASDAESGVYKVQFLLDGDVIAEDTEAPYSAYCALKHSGAGVIKVIAEDFSGNTAEDTLDITYYKFL